MIPINIYDVSKAAGVSIATVSRVLNGAPHVSEKTRRKVLSVMEELGYTPNMFARGLGLGTSRTIGVLCTDTSDLYQGRAVFYLENELRAEGYMAILCCTGRDLENKQNAVRLLLAQKVDALILAGSRYIEPIETNNAYIREAAEQVPVVLMNGSLAGENLYSICCDDRSAVYNAVRALLAQGRRQIHYLYTNHSSSGNKKRRGYELAMEDAGLSFEEKEHYCRKDIAAAQETLAQLHEQGVPMDAVVTSTDALAVGAVKFAARAGLSIPKQLAVIGYDDTQFAQCTQPEITSIDSRVDYLCHMTVKLLMEVLAGQDAPTRTDLPARLVVRGTTDFES